MDAIDYFFVNGLIEQTNYDQKYYITILLNKVANDYKIKLDWENTDG